MTTMTTKLKNFQEMEHNFFANQVPKIDYAECKFIVQGDSQRPYKYFTYYFAKLMREDFASVGMEVKVFYEHKDGTWEDFTKYFPLAPKQGTPLSEEQLSAINEQGKVLVNILKTKKSLVL